MGSECSTTRARAIQLKRAYEPPETHDGVRVLVDRLWARGVSKDVARLDAWMKELGPTAELRKWFGHRPERWEAFVDKYRQELGRPLRQLLLTELKGIAARSTLTLVYGTHDTRENEAVVLRQYLLADTPHPESTWTASNRLLMTVSVVAAAHHDGTAPASGLTLFASRILTKQENDVTLKDLLTSGALRQTSDGWQVTSRGLQRIRQISSTGSTKGTSS